jgi:hypothetical protein
MPYVVGKMFWQNSRASQDLGPLHYVFQLSDVAWILVFEKHHLSFTRNLWLWTASGSTAAFKKVPYEERDVFFSLPKRWNGNIDNIQPVEEILPKAPGLNLSF